MISGIRSIKQKKLNVVHPMKGPVLFNVKDKKLIPISVPGILKSIGLNSVPMAVRKSRFFTVSDLFKFSKLKSVPAKEDVFSFMVVFDIPSDKDYQFYHRRSKKLIERNDIENAFMVALIPELTG
jgi:hypothetical protein